MADPLVWTLAYQTEQFTGHAGEHSVFESLVSPPASGVAATTAGDDAAKAVGVVLDPNPALLDRTRQRDGMRDFYDSASIYQEDRERPEPG